MAETSQALTRETIPRLFARQAAALAQRPLFLVKRQGAYGPVSWAQAAADVSAFSLFLLSQEVKKGDRVVLLSENRPEWGIADLAIQSVGAWTVPLYPNLSEADARTICDDAQPVMAVASTSEQVQKLVNATRQLASLRAIVVIEPAQEHHAHVLHWDRALARGREMEPRLRDLQLRRGDQASPEDIATLIYTSGTTGEPKGVMLSHRNFLSNVAACLEVIPIREGDTHLSFLPLCHVFERMAGWYLMMAVGARVAFVETMDTVPDNMREVRPTVMLGVPRFFEKLYARIQEGIQAAPPVKRRLARWAMRVGRAWAARRLDGQRVPLLLGAQYRAAERLVFSKFKARMGGRLRFFVSGSAPLSKEIGEFFYGLGMTIIEGYGLTETSPVISANRLERPKFGTVGLPVPGVQVRIADDGEILTKGPHVMQGYYRKPDATAAVVVDGWFHTGDIGRMDADGRLCITDRKKDLIKTAGGKFVAPQKLEKLFVTDPLISQAFIYGDRRPYCVALILPSEPALRRYAEEHGIPGASLADWVRAQAVIDLLWDRVQDLQRGLAGFEQIKKIALLDQEFSLAAGELTPTLKVKRAAVAQRYASLLDRLYQP
jgi:long-chain acyl-CoA synthetase